MAIKEMTQRITDVSEALAQGDDINFDNMSKQLIVMKDIVDQGFSETFASDEMEEIMSEKALADFGVEIVDSRTGNKIVEPGLGDTVIKTIDGEEVDGYTIDGFYDDFISTLETMKDSKTAGFKVALSNAMNSHDQEMANEIRGPTM